MAWLSALFCVAVASAADVASGPSAKDRARTEDYLNDLSNLRKNLARANNRRAGQNGKGTNNWGRFHTRDGKRGAGFDPSDPTGDGLHRARTVLPEKHRPEAVKQPVQAGLAWTWRMYEQGEEQRGELPAALVKALDKLVRSGRYGQHDSVKYTKSRGDDFWRIYLKTLSDPKVIEDNTKADGMVNAGYVMRAGRPPMHTIYMIQNKVLDDQFDSDRVHRAEIARQIREETSKPEVRRATSRPEPSLHRIHVGPSASMRSKPAKMVRSESSSASSSDADGDGSSSSSGATNNPKDSEREQQWESYQDEDGYTRYGYTDEEGRFHYVDWAEDGSDRWYDRVWDDQLQDWHTEEKTS